MARGKKTVARLPKHIEPMTVAEFRAKLEGIEMFQPENWVPTAEQWNLIREMINKIVETSPQPMHDHWTTTPIKTPEAATQRTTLPLRTQEGVSSTSFPAPAVVIPTVPEDGLKNMSLSQIKAMAEAKNGGKLVNPLKTPSVDTSGGVYKSQFE